MVNTQAEDTPLPYPHAEPPIPPVLVYGRNGLALRYLEDGDPGGGDALVASSVLQATSGARVRVSTAFLGIDASLGLLDTPLLFETVVAGSGGSGPVTVQRHATEEEALAAHLQLLGQAARALGAPQPSAPPAPEATAVPPAEPGR